jgi:predicted SprT family Zn-dependent metalloprotease
MSIQKVQAKVIETQEKLAALGYPKFDIKHVEVATLQRGVSGYAMPNQLKIQISADYLREFENRVLNQTVPHEVVHLYVSKYFPRAKQYHGREFRHLMGLLGLPTDTKHNMMLSTETSHARRVRRFIYLTEQTKREIQLTIQQHNKMIKNAQAGSYFTSKGEKLVWTTKEITL